MSVSVVVGNPKANSRTLEVAKTLAECLLVPGTYDMSVIDLAEHAGDIFDQTAASVNEAVARVAGSDLAIFAAPTYKAAYTGLLKAFLDRYPSDGLSGVTAIPLLTGADLGHSLAPSATLTPLLTELGAVVPGRGFYFVTSQMDSMRDIVQRAAEVYVRNMGQVARLLPVLADQEQA
ncbi:NAD(P)H-dependent oxidoreductase [Microbacterium lushaniae]|uniref:NAD(P)H-dependent oxidoreductase n=1 Tax=Microbacterium lushaniae TaxID=2614639 RepID=A0A5J6L915_9MICO|nr:NAD(P)H-dependent oxidoreductase [Microbacterium lushaniae]